MKKKMLPVLMGAVFTGYAINSGAQANLQLSNLSSPTAVNQSLQPGTDNSINLGSSTRQWKYLYLHDRLYLNGTLTMYTLGTDNFFVGPGAGNNTVVSGNTALGTNALHSVVGGGSNTAIGTEALLNNSSGGYNTAIGSEALYSNTDGNYNTATGEGALANNTTGSYNTASGVFAMSYNDGGFNNTAVGYEALGFNTDGGNNTAIGSNALAGNGTGTRNTALGSSAGYLASGDRNTFIGCKADGGFSTLNNTTALGFKAAVSASNQVRIGNNTVTSIGGYVNWSNISDERVKKNIRNNVPGLAFINKLNPITYNLDLDAADKIIQRSAAKIKDSKTAEPEDEDITMRKAKEQVLYTGFVAQDVERAAKELNYDFSGVDAAKNDKDLYGLRYADFVVPLVKAVQELSQQNDELRSRIEKLEAMVVNGTVGNSSLQQTDKITLANAALEQNIPNPFANTTRISYTLPRKFLKAQLMITDKSCRTIKQVALAGVGRNSVEIDADALTSGVYSYSLYVDGKLIATKEMLLVK